MLQTIAIAATTIAEKTTIEDKLSGKTTILEEIELGLFTDFRQGQLCLPGQGSL